MENKVVVLTLNSLAELPKLLEDIQAGKLPDGQTFDLGAEGTEDIDAAFEQAKVQVKEVLAQMKSKLN